MVCFWISCSVELVDVDLGLFLKHWSELELRANPRQNQGDTQWTWRKKKQRQRRAKLKNEQKWLEEKASAAVMAIGMVKTPEQKKAKLNNRDAEKFWPETYTADRVDKKSFAEFLGDGKTAGMDCRFPQQAIVMSDWDPFSTKCVKAAQESSSKQ